MAKRRSTTKTSSNETEDKVDALDGAETAGTSDEVGTDPETVAEAVDAVDAYAPSDKENDSDTMKPEDADQVIELAEPGSPPASGKDDDAAAAEDAKDTSEPADTALADETASEQVESASTEEPLDNATPVETADVTDTLDDKPTPPAPQILRETVVEQKGGFLPMLAGGAIAAVLGYGVAAYVSQDVWPFVGAAKDDPFVSEVRGALASQESALADMAGRVTTLEGVEPPTFDLSPVETGIAAVQDSVATLSARLDEMAARIDTLEKQPLEQAVSPEAIAAYERALADLQAEVEAQRTEVAKMAQEAIQAEGNATEQAMLAAARAAMADVTAALETGAGFASALDVLSLNGYDVPGPLAAVASSGVATQVQLIEDFPDAARQALAAVRSSETENAEGSNRIATFFANQLGARSVSPREGDDTDAILSRSEAALRTGDLATAIAELSSLPELARTAVADWEARAQSRLEAKTAADALVQQLLQK